ncbi:MAG: hypothetical protein UI647_09695 [Negativibacillus sp.]
MKANTFPNHPPDDLGGRAFYEQSVFENFFTCKKFSNFPKCAETIRFRPLRRAPYTTTFKKGGRKLYFSQSTRLYAVGEQCPASNHWAKIFDLIRRASVVTKALPCVKTAVSYKTKARNSLRLQAGRKFEFTGAIPINE